MRRWRTEETPGQTAKIVIVVNTTFELCPWADILYAMDRNWWETYYKKNNKHFEGLKITAVSGLSCAKRVPFQNYQNSGVGAISLAAHFGAAKIILLGYDCQKTGGKAHWHGNHPTGLGNAGSINTWPGMFDKLKKDLAGSVEIINSTRETALTMFDKKPLIEGLEA